MLANQNHDIITGMAKKSFATDRRRNGILVLAIALSVFLVFTILTVGSTWFRMQKVQNIRMQGGEYGAVLYGGFTEEQRRVCEANEDVEAVGAEGFGAWAKQTEFDKTVHTSFIWSDETMWKKLHAAAREHTSGQYPTRENEVMATKEALEDCGLAGYGIGDSFSITYEDSLGVHTKELTISGMWEGFGDKKVFFVAKSFFEQTGYTLEDPGRGLLYIKFKSPLVTEKMQNRLRESLHMEKKQALLFTGETRKSVRMLAGVAGLIAVTCLCAYLLIYNIMYLSVSGRIRYYGLLGTVGMTGRQIKELVRKQMLFLGSIGVAVGLFLGVLVSYGIIPGVVRTFGIRQKDISIAFHPVSFLLAVLIAAGTIYLGSRKPAKIAAEISPMEALGYCGISGKRPSHRSGRGRLLWSMARKQLRKDKKRTALVVLSLGVGLSVFLCLTTLSKSQGARTIVSNYMDTDLVISNDTMQMEKQENWKPLITEELLKNLESNTGIRAIHPVSNAQIVIPWEPELLEYWMQEFFDRWMNEEYSDVREDYKAHPEKYSSFLRGIDETEFRYLNASLKEPVDETDFLEGRTCILIQNELSLKEEKVIGKELHFYLDGKEKREGSLTIAGMTEDSEYHYSYLVGTTPTLIVSSAYLKKIAAEPYVSQVTVRYEKEYDRETEEEILALLKKSSYAKDFSYDSKLEELASVEKSQGNLMGIGMGITLILAFIGLMNYINTVSGNVWSRQIELAVLESIGMTEKQVRKLLIREGLLYGGLSLLVAATAGLAVTYALYQSVNYRGIPFAVPLMPVLAMAGLILLACVSIPLAAYRAAVGKRSVVERLRRIG